MDKKIIRAALLGFGTVGTGVYKVLQKQKEDMIPKLGSQIEIKKILVRNQELHGIRRTVTASVL